MNASADVILAATNLGPDGDEAVRQAAELARRQGRLLRVCHVVPSLTLARPLFPQLKRADAEGELGFEAAVAEQLTERVARVTGLAGSDFGVAVVRGSPHGGILGEAERAGAGLVVVGGRAAPEPGLSHTAELVVRYSGSPVLVARPSAGGGPILAATDLSEPSLPAVAAAVEEATRLGSGLVVIHVVETMPVGAGPFGMPLPVPSSAQVADWLESARSEVVAALARLGSTAEARVCDGHPAQAILQAARELRTPLIVVGTRGKTGLERIAIGSVAETVARESPCSVLVVRLRSS